MIRRADFVARGVELGHRREIVSAALNVVLGFDVPPLPPPAGPIRQRGGYFSLSDLRANLQDLAFEEHYLGLKGGGEARLRILQQVAGECVP